MADDSVLKKGIDFLVFMAEAMEDNISDMEEAESVGCALQSTLWAAGGIEVTAESLHAVFIGATLSQEGNLIEETSEEFADLTIGISWLAQRLLTGTLDPPRD